MTFPTGSHFRAGKQSERTRRAMMTSTTIDCFRAWVALLLAIVLAAGLLALVAETKPAEAAFPGNNGQIVFSSDRDGDYEIYAKSLTSPTPVPLTNNSATDVVPAFSPDGQKIAFKSNRDGNGEVYVMDADGSNPTRLTKNSTDDTSPAFSPDGDKIVFVRLQDGTYEIYAMDAVDGDADGNGDNQVRLTNNSANDFGPVFSPNGQKIAFSSERDGDHEIFVMSKDGTKQTRLTSNSTSDTDPAYSPNGQKIAFASFRDGGSNSEVYVMNSDGSGQTNLTNNTAGDGDPAYAPDGTKIAFASSRDGDSEVYEMNADGSGMPVSLTSDPAFDSAPDWQPVCTISGTTGDDFITANQSPGNDVICGLGGSDQIDAGGGHDIVIGGNENDFIVGGSGRDRVFGGLGNDTLNVRDGVRRNDLVHGGDGTDICKRDRKDRRVSCP
jgi:dipeptidyl aminopeptidase/acylaminoacyl peptidase